MAISSSSTGLRPGVVTSTTRPTNPYTGMLIYETDTGYLRVWDGSAWDYLSQKQDDTVGLGPVDGLVLVKTQTITGSPTTVTVSSCFNTDFNSYRIVFANIVNNGSGNNVYLKLDNTTGSTYSFSGPYQQHNSATLTGATASATNVGMLVGFTNTTIWSSSMDIYNPNVAAATTFISQHAGVLLSGHFMGADTNAAASTGFTLSTTTFTFTGGTIRVYGYRNS